MPSKDPAEVYRQLKKVPRAKLKAAGRAAMVSFSEKQFAADKRRIAERARRLGPVHRKLEAALRKSPEMAAVVKGIDALKKPARPAALPPAKKRLFAPDKPLIRLDSIHVVETLPFSSDTWSGQSGTSNDFYGPPSADGTAGNLGFGMEPGISSSGQMACWAAIGAQLAIPNSPCIINFTANPSVNWSVYWGSSWWRQAAGNIWAGLYVAVFNADGSFLDSAVDTQISVASFNDENFLDSGENVGSNSAMPLSGGTIIGFPFPFSGDGEGGFLQYWCWIGGSCNADGSNDQSYCLAQMNANCSSLTVDIFEF
jgi:hypothetical protein